MLIPNGTYKEDGTVNKETARPLGWDEVWKAKSRPQPQPSRILLAVEVLFLEGRGNRRGLFSARFSLECPFRDG